MSIRHPLSAETDGGMPRGKIPHFLLHGELKLRIDQEGPSRIVSLYGELDLHTAEVLESELRSLEASAADALVLDLSGLEFIDSTGLGVLLRACDRSRGDGNRLAMLRPRDEVQRTLEISGIAEFMPFVD